MSAPREASFAFVKRAGKLQFDAERSMAAYIKHLPDGFAGAVTFRKPVRHRSSPQVAYYFSTVIPEFANHLGYRRDEHYQLHDGLMHKLWPLAPDKFTKQPRRRRLTLKEHGTEPPLSHEEMGIHLEQVIVIAAEEGCIITDPTPADVRAWKAEHAEYLGKVPTYHRADPATVAA